MYMKIFYNYLTLTFVNLRTKLHFYLINFSFFRLNYANFIISHKLDDVFCLFETVDLFKFFRRHNDFAVDVIAHALAGEKGYHIKGA